MINSKAYSVLFALAFCLALVNAASVSIKVDMDDNGIESGQVGQHCFYVGPLYICLPFEQMTETTDELNNFEGSPVPDSEEVVEVLQETATQVPYEIVEVEPLQDTANDGLSVDGHCCHNLCGHIIHNRFAEKLCEGVCKAIPADKHQICDLLCDKLHIGGSCKSICNSVVDKC